MMRKPIFITLALLPSLFSTQVRADDPSPTVNATPPASSFIEVQGQATYRQRIALPPAAILTIRLMASRRHSRPAFSLAEQDIPLSHNAPPIDFTLTVDRDLLEQQTQLIAYATISVNGKPLFIGKRTVSHHPDQSVLTLPAMTLTPPIKKSRP